MLALHRRRYYRRLHLTCAGVEPRGKQRMPAADKLAFQAAILQQLEAQRRRAFRGPVVVQIAVRTTRPNPPHGHTIAKNLLDLLARPAN